MWHHSHSYLRKDGLFANRGLDKCAEWLSQRVPVIMCKPDLGPGFDFRLDRIDICVWRGVVAQLEPVAKMNLLLSISIEQQRMDYKAAHCWEGARPAPPSHQPCPPTTQPSLNPLTTHTPNHPSHWPTHILEGIPSPVGLPSPEVEEGVGAFALRGLLLGPGWFLEYIVQISPNREKFC